MIDKRKKCPNNSTLFSGCDYDQFKFKVLSACIATNDSFAHAEIKVILFGLRKHTNIRFREQTD